MPQLEAQEWKYRNGHISEAKFLLNGPTYFSKVRAHGVLHFQKKIPKILKNKMSAGRLTSLASTGPERARNVPSHRRKLLVYSVLFL